MNTHKIAVIKDKANIVKPEIYHANDGERILDWLIKTFGPDGMPYGSVIYNGRIAEDCIVNQNDYDAMNAQIRGPLYITAFPMGTEVFVAVLIAVLTIALTPTPDLPTSPRPQNRSPNNALSGQTNIARLGDRVPDIFGQVLSYPDLIAPTVIEYIDHIKFQREYVCFSRGFCDVIDTKAGDTLIDDIPGASIDVYEPGLAPTEVFKTRQSNEVTGQELRAPNDRPSVAFESGDTITYTVGTDKATLTTTNNNKFDIFSNGETIEVTDLRPFDETDNDLSGTYVIDAPTATTLVLRDAAVVNPLWSLYDGITELVAFSIFSNQAPLNPTAKKLSLISVVGPFIVPGDNLNNQCWIDLNGPQGLASGPSLNDAETVNMVFEFEEVDESGALLGPSFQVNINKTDSTRDERFWTEKITISQGYQPNTRYRVSGWRTNDGDAASTTLRDEVRWSRLAGIQNIGGADQTGTTRAIIETQASEQVANLQEKKFNAIVSRRVINYSGGLVVGDIETGVGLNASRRMADIFLHYCLDPLLGARQIDNIDAVAIYAIQQSMDSVFNGEKGEFGFTFDSKNTPAIEEMRVISNACRCIVTRTGGYFSMVRDEAQTTRKALFNRRNKLPSSEAKSTRLNNQLENDGVILEYNDIEDNIVRAINLPDDLPAGDQNYGLETPVNPLTIESAGIRQYSQAWDRAQYEFNRIIYKRIQIESSVSSEGLLLSLNDRVAHADGTRLVKLESDGEIKSISGLSVVTSEPCFFEPGQTYSVIIRNGLGDPAPPVLVTERSDSKNGFVLSIIPTDIVIRGDDGIQRGSLYNFGPDGSELANDYLIQQKDPDRDGNVKLKMINYAPEYYQADNQEPPEKANIS